MAISLLYLPFVSSKQFFTEYPATLTALRTRRRVRPYLSVYAEGREGDVSGSTLRVAMAAWPPAVVYVLFHLLSTAALPFPSRWRGYLDRSVRPP